MEDPKLAEKRWADLEALQEHYAVFQDLVFDVITELMGFTCTEQQLDIADYVANGPLYRMVQAQRGEAKTTITAIYAVYRLIHNPKTRVLILSAGTDLAIQVSNWIIQIIMQMPELECLRPDESFGDRKSVKAFDVHHTLRGAEKSASVACLGITSNIQGYRADLLIPDDIESAKNSQTAVQRQRLAHLTKDFTSICSKGDILYLGTPQNNDSVYNSLPSRGFDIRIWPGRFPTKKELPHYGNFLAPWIKQKVLENPSLQTGGGPTGEDGQPTDPVLLSEEVLCKKQLDQGKAYFQLQHMLDTRLLDEDRYPLKCRDIIFMNVPKDRSSIQLNWQATESNRIHPPQGYPLQEEYYEATGGGEEYGFFNGTHMYVDPSGGGQNGDELAFAVTRFLAGRVYVIDSGGRPGGFSPANLQWLSDKAVEHNVTKIDVEENFGKGAFLRIWQPVLLATKRKDGTPFRCAIEEVWETGQKELRIIDVLEPIISSNRLVIDKDLIQKDWASVQRYPTEKQACYSLLFQLARITRDKGALIHDDRLDALASSCRFWSQALAQDAAKLAARIKEDNYRRMVQNPLGNGRKIPGFKGPSVLNSLSKFRRK